MEKLHISPMLRKEQQEMMMMMMMSLLQLWGGGVQHSLPHKSDGTASKSTILVLFPVGLYGAVYF
jgi:hypothetical protein